MTERVRLLECVAGRVRPPKWCPSKKEMGCHWELMAGRVRPPKGRPSMNARRKGSEGDDGRVDSGSHIYPLAQVTVEQEAGREAMGAQCLPVLPTQKVAGTSLQKNKIALQGYFSQ